MEGIDDLLNFDVGNRFPDVSPAATREVQDSLYRADKAHDLKTRHVPEIVQGCLQVPISEVVSKDSELKAAAEASSTRLPCAKTLPLCGLIQPIKHLKMQWKGE